MKARHRMRITSSIAVGFAALTLVGSASANVLIQTFSCPYPKRATVFFFESSGHTYEASFKDYNVLTGGFRVSSLGSPHACPLVYAACAGIASHQSWPYPWQVRSIQIWSPDGGYLQWRWNSCSV
jgi:hypothetical protein